ncbi:hypothetical protein IEO21_00167 [Rhodonia placenta]|uniref:Uncharacterized protein n=1 Tax=Rhodonia placenta TaxID=104341 RepID=A0A8H7PC88_9APHY|nr:hypothetical protein IEO21_00167 [Postia placenta]
MADGDTHISIPLGITVGLLASFIQSLGLTIQRKSHVINQSLPESERRVEHRRPLWLFGFAIFISSNLFGSVFQIASLPVVILAPLGAVSLLWNAFFARILLGDVFSIWMLIGTLLIAGGAVLVAVFGIVPEPTHSLEDLLMLFNRPVFVVYFSLLGIATVVCLAITHIAEYSYTRKMALPAVSPPLSPLIAPNSHPSILTTTTTASHTADPSERTPLLDRKPRARSHSHGRSKSPSLSGTTSNQSILSNAIIFTTQSTRTPLFLAASYASFSGIISGMCLLFAKSGVELLMLTIAGDNQFWRWQAWILLLSLGICALLQLWYMHKSLVLADPTVVCPLAFCLYNLSSIINGLVYFDQFSLLSKTQLLLVLLGISILLAGVWIVSFPPTGGYSIDIGAWTHDEADAHSFTSADSYDSALEEGEDDEEILDDEPLPMDARRRSRTLPLPSRPPSEDIGMGPVAPDAHATSQPPPPADAPRLSLVPSNATAPPAPRQSTLLAPAEAMPRSRSSYAADSTGSPSTRRRRTLAAPLSPPPFAGPLAPSGSALGGFAIGLSPVSPGFALVPERRRRVSARRGSVGDEESGRRSMRRVVSEGTVPGDEAPRGRVGREEEREALLPGAPTQGRRAKGRWKWVRNVFAAATHR